MVKEAIKPVEGNKPTQNERVKKAKGSIQLQFVETALTLWRDNQNLDGINKNPVIAIKEIASSLSEENNLTLSEFPYEVLGFNIENGEIEHNPHSCERARKFLTGSISTIIREIPNKKANNQPLNVQEQKIADLSGEIQESFRVSGSKFVTFMRAVVENHFSINDKDMPLPDPNQKSKSKSRDYSQTKAYLLRDPEIIAWFLIEYKRLKEKNMPHDLIIRAINENPKFPISNLKNQEGHKISKNWELNDESKAVPISREGRSFSNHLD